MKIRSFSPARLMFLWGFPKKNPRFFGSKPNELLNLRIVLSPWCFFQTMNVLFNRWWRRRQLSRQPVALFGKRWFWKGCKGVARTGQWDSSYEMNTYVSKGFVHWISNDISADSTSGNSKHVGDMLVCLNDVRQPRNAWWMDFSWPLVLPLETVARTHTDETKNGRMKAL